MRTLGRLLTTVLVGGVAVALGAALLMGWGRDVASSKAVDIGKTLDLQPLAVRSVVYARDGSVIDIWHAEEDRVPVSLASVPAHVVRAVLDAEDDRFFEHGALDVRALARALVVNVQSGGVQEGGSTITQQLVKVALLNSRQDVGRKVKEAALAIRLASRMTKQQILESYVNTVYFGNGAYGLQAAAERYFKTNVERLTIGQGIVLASLIRDPVGADPFVHPTAARHRRDLVIDRMRALNHITPAEAADLKGEPLPAPPPQPPVKGSDYFAEHVKQLLLADPRLGSSLQERTFALFKGGLAIHTTLDPAYQQMAESAVASILPDTGGQFNAAVVSVDPSTGAVRSLVGGPNFAQAKFNLATDGIGRQPGSSFKVFTLIAALEHGMSPNDVISGSAPCPIPNPGGAPNPWNPGNAEGEGAGTLTLTDATVHSINCAYARLIKLIGPEKVVEVAHRMGITKALEPSLSITLGTEEVPPLQMASAYATLAADGERHTPYFIDRVEDRHGKVLFRAVPKGERVISSDIARTVNSILTQVVQRGTGTAAGVPRWTVAGKTGTTNDYANAWFVGYTPNLSTAVWMGSPDGNVPMRSVGGIKVFGGTYPARIWHAYMVSVVGDSPPVDFPPPPAVQPPSQLLLLAGERPRPRRVPVAPSAPVIVVPVPQAPAPQQPVVTVPVVTVPPRRVIPTIPTVVVPRTIVRPPIPTVPSR